jgi:pyruvate formate lyase activating enzyme
MENPATKVEVMYEDRDIAKKYLNYVYLSNVADTDNSTYCPKCSNKIIERNGYRVQVNIINSKCPKCGYKINIIL